MRRYMGKMVAVWLASLLLMLCVTGCVKESGEGEKKKSSDSDKIQIGMCFDSFVIERWQRDRDVFVSMAKDLGVILKNRKSRLTTLSRTEWMR